MVDCDIVYTEVVLGLLTNPRHPRLTNSMLMRSKITPRQFFDFLRMNDADCLGSHINDMGQQMLFFEHPMEGDMANVIVAFPEFKVAFNSDFFDLEDMTATYHDIGMFLDEPNEDMDYVPYLFDVLDKGLTMKFKYELSTAEEFVRTEAVRKKSAV